MGSHKVILTKISLQSDLRGAVQAVAALLHVEKRAAADLLKHLPLTLSSGIGPEQARRIVQLFEDLQCQVQVTPPLSNLPQSESRAGKAVPSDFPVARPQRRRWWRAALLVIAIAAIGVVGMRWGGEWILRTVRAESNMTPDRAMKLVREGRSAEVHRAFSRQENQNAQQMIAQAVALVAMARNQMEENGWRTFGKGAQVPERGQDLMDVSEMRQALALLEQAQALDPNNPLVYRWKAFALQQKGLFSEALAEAQKALALDSSSAEFWNLLGTIQLEDGQLGRADHSFRQALAIAPHEGNALKNLGALYFYHSGDTARGLAFLLRYCIGPGERDLDRMVLRRDMVAAAWTQFNEPLEKNLPDTMDFRTYETRRQLLQNALQTQRTAILHEDLAMLYLARRQWLPAAAELQKAIAMDSKLFSAHRMRVLLLARDGEWDVARNQLKRAIKEGAKDPFFFKNKGVLEQYYDLSPQTAKKSWNEYLRLGGDSYRAGISANLAGQ